MRVRLTRRLATYIDGVNLSAHSVGDVFEVTRHEAELRKRLQRIRAPTLVIWGREDRMLPVGHAKSWQALIQGSKVEIVEQAGHLLLDESGLARAAVARFMKNGDGSIFRVTTDDR